MIKNDFSFAFFGTSDVSVSVLNALKNYGYIPKVIITVTDKPKGRKMIITPPPVKVWAQDNSIDFLQPENLDQNFMKELHELDLDLSIVVAYGKIMPKEILSIPKHGSINIHYSLLPNLRGSSPVEGAILQDIKNTGVSIILMDEKMDHGPIIAQEKVIMPIWPPKRSELMNAMNMVANQLLIDTIPKWINGEIKPLEQEHTKATFVSMIKKEDALIDLTDSAYNNYRKIMAYDEWPRAYFIENNKRVIITSAEYSDGKLKILRVIPEGKKEMSYNDYRKVTGLS